MAVDQFEYDVALSFAAEDRSSAEDLDRLLRAKDRKVLLDEYQAAETESGNLVTHIAELYRTKARYCVMLISRHYPLKTWTEAERTSVQQRALRDASQYIIPVQLDDTRVPGITGTKGYQDLREHSLEHVVNLLEAKLTETTSRAGPPPESHDLRSGNVPSSPDKS